MARSVNSVKNKTQFALKRHATGWASGGSAQTQFFSGGTAVVRGNRSFSVDNKNYTYIEHKTGIITPELIIFSVFFVFALFFVILVWSIDAPIAPKIICGIMLAATFIPIVVSLLRSPRRAIFKLDSSGEFIALNFMSRADRQRFLQALAALSVAENKQVSDRSYQADVTLNMFDDDNKKSYSGATVQAETGRVKVTTASKQVIYVDYFGKSHDLIWQLYPFGSVFVVMPIFAIIWSIVSGEFETGILFTLIFLFAGIVIMLVPSIISRGKLLLMGRDGYVKLSFLDSKIRRNFERDLEQLRGYQRQTQQLSGARGREGQQRYRIFNIARYDFPTGWAIATVVYLAFVIALITSLDLVVIFFGAYIGFVFYSFFYIFYRDVMRQNKVIWLRRSRVYDSEFVEARIIEFTVKDLRMGRRYYFNIDIITERVVNGEVKVDRFCKKMQREYPDYCVGQSVTLATSGMTVSLILDESTAMIRTVAQGRASDYPLTEDVADVLLPATPKKVDTTKPYGILGQWRLRMLAYALACLMLGGTASFFVWISAAGANSATRLMGAVMLAIVGSVFAVFAYLLMAHLARYIRKKAIVRKGILTKALVLNEHTVVREHTRSGNTIVKYRYCLKLLFFDEDGEMRTAYVDEEYSTNFTNYGLPDIKERAYLDVCVSGCECVVLTRFAAAKA